MNVGAPILDVQAYVTQSDPSSSSSAKKAAQPVSIISGGVVSAPGYAPVTITANSASLGPRQKSVFIPKNFSIHVRNQTIQHFIKANKTGPATSTTKVTPTVIVKPAEKVKTNNTAIIAVAVAVSLIALMVLIYCLRALYIKANFEQIQK